MASNNKKILVTGAAGLIGREIFQRLQKDHLNVIGVDNNSRFSTFIPNGNYICSDLIDFINNNENDFDIVYHMAAINGTSNFYKNPNAVLKNNTLIDLKLFEFVESNHLTKLIYASSSEIISDADEIPSSEITDITIDNIHNPRWSYRIPKIMSENYLLNSNINYVIARFFNVYSEHCGNGHFLKDIVNKLNNKNYELQSPNETRSFCYVKDAVDALFAIQHTDKTLFNIGNDEEITILEAANVIAKALNISPDWQFKSRLPGSSFRRCPDISNLRKVYPEFAPADFNTVIHQIKDKLC